MLSTAHDIADARLHRLVSALHRAGAGAVTVEALGRESDGPASATGLRTVARAGGWRRAARALRAPFAGGHDVLVILDLELVPAALVATRLRRTALVVDVHEDYRAVARDRPWARGPVGVVARMVVRLVLALASHADLTVVADDHVPPAQARRRLVVRNTPDLEELPPAGAPGPTPTAVYVGDLRPSRGLHAMIDAVAATDDWHLDLVGELREVDPDALASELERRDLTDRIRLHGRLPLAQAWERARGAWVGLCLLEDTPAYRAALPTKVYEYLAVGLPVLATPLPRIRALIEQEASAGVCVPTPADAATTLRSWSADPAVLAPLRTAASDWATHHLAAGSPFDTLAAAILTLRQDRDDP